MWDYIVYISKYGDERGVWTLSSNANMFDEVKKYVPQSFNWWLFGMGEGIILLAISFIYFDVIIERYLLFYSMKMVCKSL